MRDPLYRQIAEKLQRLIESGALAPGAKLPTEPELTEQHQASRNTIRQAVRWLINRGLVQTRPGQGTFVAELTRPFLTTLSADPETGLGGGEGAANDHEVRAQGRSPLALDPEVVIHQAAGQVAEELRLAPGTFVVGRRQRRFVDDEPFSLQESYYPMTLTDQGATRLLRNSAITEGAVSYLHDVLGLVQASYNDRIRVRAPRPEEATFFELRDNSRVSVFETFRTAFDAEGKPFRLTVTTFPADRNQFVAYAGTVPAGARLTATPVPAAENAGAPSMPGSLYRRIAESLRQDIETGRLASGSQLPTEYELTATWRTSRSTVREAIKRLTELGLVEARPGQGTFVTEKPVPIVTHLSASPDLGGGEVAMGDGLQYFIAVREQHRLPSSSTPRVEIQSAAGLVAAELQLPTARPVVSRHQERFVDGMPYSLQTSFYSMDLVTRGAVRIMRDVNVDQGCVLYLRERLGIEQVGYRDLITVRAPDAHETSFFRLPADGRIAVLETFRTSYDQAGEPIRITVTVYPADRNEFVISEGSPGGR
jgi:GntR family transcriptional regulator